MRILSNCNPADIGEVFEYAKGVYAQHINEPSHSCIYHKGNRRFVVRTFSEKHFPEGKIIIIDHTDTTGVGVGGSASARLKTISSPVIAFTAESSSVSSTSYPCAVDIAAIGQVTTSGAFQYGDYADVATIGESESVRSYGSTSLAEFASIGSVSTWSAGLRPAYGYIAATAASEHLSSLRYAAAGVVAMACVAVTFQSAAHAASADISTTCSSSSLSANHYANSGSIAVTAEGSSIQSVSAVASAETATIAESETTNSDLYPTFVTVAITASAVPIVALKYPAVATVAMKASSETYRSFRYARSSNMAATCSAIYQSSKRLESAAAAAVTGISASYRRLQYSSASQTATTALSATRSGIKMPSSASHATICTVATWTRDIYPTSAKISITASSAPQSSTAYISPGVSVATASTATPSRAIVSPGNADISITGSSLSHGGTYYSAAALVATQASSEAVGAKGYDAEALCAVVATAQTLASDIYSSFGVAATTATVTYQSSIRYPASGNMAIQAAASSVKSVKYLAAGKLASKGSAVVQSSIRYLAAAAAAATASSSTKKGAQYPASSKSAITASAVSVRRLIPTITIIDDHWDVIGSDSPLVANSQHGGSSGDAIIIGTTGSIQATSDSGGVITYISSNPEIATIDATGHIVVISLAGSVSFTITVAATADYLSGYFAGQAHTFSKKNPVIAWPYPYTLAYPNPLSVFCSQIRGLNINGSFEFSASEVLPGSIVTPLDETAILPVTGNANAIIYYRYTPYDTLNYAVVEDAGWLTMIKGTLTVISGNVNQEVRIGSHITGRVLLSNGEYANLMTFPGALPVVVLDAAKKMWTEAYAGTTPLVSQTIIYTWYDDPNYNDLQGVFSITAREKTSQTISAITVSGTVLERGGGWGTLHATASSGLPVTFSCSNPNAYITGASVYCRIPGSYTIRADQVGNTDYYAAPAVTTTLVVRQPAVYFSIGSNGPIANGRLNFMGGSGAYTWSYYGQPTNMTIQSNAGWNNSNQLNVNAYTLPCCYPYDGWYKIVDNNDSANIAMIYMRDWLPLINGSIGSCTAPPDPGGGGGGGTVTYQGMAGRWLATFEFTQRPGHTRNVIMELVADGTGIYQSDDFLDGDNFQIGEIGFLDWRLSNGILLVDTRGVGQMGYLWAMPWKFTSDHSVYPGDTSIDIYWTSMTGIDSYPEDWGPGIMQRQ